MLGVSVILGSTRDGRACETVGRWFAGLAAGRDDLAVEILDLAAYAFPSRYPRTATPAMREFAAKVAGADAFVIVTPEYHRSFPAPLKQAIDYVYDEWHAKPVGFVSYGCGSTGHYAVEQLRTVFAALHTVAVRDWVGLDLLADADGDGRPLGTDDRLRAVAALLDQLTWWGRALKEARRAHPYVS